MTTNDFRELLRHYLMEPEYATVTYFDENGMHVKLPNGERFDIRIHPITKPKHD